MDDCLVHKDPIRCSPSFHNRQRFDTVFVQTQHSLRPARLHLVFEVRIFDLVWQMARITYFTAINPTALDRTIGMRLYEEEAHGEFITLSSIVRSCYMSPADAKDKQLLSL
jgi:hypothetical protein